MIGDLMAMYYANAYARTLGKPQIKAEADTKAKVVADFAEENERMYLSNVAPAPEPLTDRSGSVGVPPKFDEGAIGRTITFEELCAAGMVSVDQLIIDKYPCVDGMIHGHGELVADPEIKPWYKPQTMTELSRQRVEAVVETMFASDEMDMSYKDASTLLDFIPHEHILRYANSHL